MASSFSVVYALACYDFKDYVLSTIWFMAFRSLFACTKIETQNSIDKFDIQSTVKRYVIFYPSAIIYTVFYYFTLYCIIIYSHN